MEGSIDISVDPQSEEIANESHTSSRKRVAVVDAVRVTQNNTAMSNHPTTAGEGSEKRRKEAKVVIPDKGSSKSQYVVRQKVKKENEDKEQKKAKSKKKFINMALNMKKFNGVVLGSDQVISGNDVSQTGSHSNMASAENQGFCKNDELAESELIDRPNVGIDRMSRTAGFTGPSWHASAVKQLSPTSKSRGTARAEKNSLAMTSGMDIVQK